MILNIFDTIQGLPVHPLIAHAVVVIMPLSALGMIAIVVKPALRERFGSLILSGVVMSVLSSVIAKNSGEALGERIGEPEQHSDLGEMLPIVAIVFAVVSFGWWFLNKRNASQLIVKVAALAVVLASVGALVGTYLVGHSGAQAVWQERIEGTTPEDDDDYVAPTESATPTEEATAPVDGAISLSEVAKHNSPDDCWAAINGKVYDFTEWIARHPGGSGVIEGMCGSDGSSAFNGEHAGDDDPTRYLAEYEIGVLG